MRALTSWAQVAASSGERRREAVLLAAERAQRAEGVAAEQRLGRGANAHAVTGRTGEGRSWAQKRGVSGRNGDGPDRWARAVRGARATRGGRLQALTCGAQLAGAGALAWALGDALEQAGAGRAGLAGAGRREPGLGCGHRFGPREKWAAG